MKKKKKKPPYRLRACRGKRGCTLTSWETMIGKTFETIKKAA